MSTLVKLTKVGRFSHFNINVVRNSLKTVFEIDEDNADAIIDAIVDDDSEFFEQTRFVLRDSTSLDDIAEHIFVINALGYGCEADKSGFLADPV